MVKTVIQGGRAVSRGCVYGVGFPGKVWLPEPLAGSRGRVQTGEG